LAEPDPELLDHFVFLGEDRPRAKLLVVPNHDVARDVDAFSEECELHEPSEVPRAIEIVAELLHERLYRSQSLEDNHWTKRTFDEQNHVAWAILLDSGLHFHHFKLPKFNKMRERDRGCISIILIDSPSEFKSGEGTEFFI
jgi:hypothetical protein